MMGSPNAEAHHPRSWRRPARLAILLVFAMHLLRYIAYVPLDYYPGGDGYYIHMFARSLAYDGDIELTNDYRVCGDPWNIGHDAGTGHPANPWYIGPALIWAPILFVLRHLPIVPDGAPAVVRFGCRGILPYLQGFLLAPTFAALTTYLGYRVARRFVSEGAASTAVLVIGLGSGLAIFGPLWWNYAHVWAAATLTLGVLLFLRATERPDVLRRWFLAGAAFGAASLMRPHHAVFILALGAHAAYQCAIGLRERRFPKAAIIAGLVSLAGFVPFFGLRLAVYDYLYGSPWPPTLRHVYLQPTHAHPWFLLFSGRAGLIAYSPLLWLSVVGLFLSLRLRAHRAFIWCTTLAFALDYWICASPLEWPGGATVGPRLLVSFVGLFLVWAALALERIFAWARANSARLARVAVAGWLMPPLLVSWMMTKGDGPYDAPSMYATAVRDLLEPVYARIGNPAVFPAPLVFAARYRTEPREFDRLAVYGMFQHDFERGRLVRDDAVDFARPLREALLREGFVPTDRAQRLVPNRYARFLVTLAWPFVTRVDVALAEPPGRDDCYLEVDNALFWSRRTIGRATIPHDMMGATFATPIGTFDSGINEVRLRSNCALEVQRFRFVDESGQDRETFLPRSDTAGRR